MKPEVNDLIKSICEADQRYAENAYEFVLESLNFTQKKFRREKHVTGKELLEGIKILLMQRFGPMTINVLKHWGINSTEDFGNIVFNLVNKKVLSKTEDDTLEHFKDAYNFDIVFREGYRRKLHRDVSRLR